MRPAFAVSCCLLALAPARARAEATGPAVAFTFDDGPKLGETPRLSAQERNQALLDALGKHHVTAALFVTVANGADRPEGLLLARAWGAAGHFIGNHTITHPDLNDEKVTLAAYQKEVLDCDAVIRALPGYQKWLRFTFLREGNTPEKRDGMREFLRSTGYRNAYVTLDTSDWRLAQALTKLVQKDPAADLAPFKKVYLAHLWQRAEAYSALSRRLLGREIPQVLLLHHNLINALWLGDAIAMFKEKGWAITDPARAYADPVYQLQPERDRPGQSLLLSMGRVLGVKKFDGWERLVDDGDFEIAELEKLYK